MPITSASSSTTGIRVARKRATRIHEKGSIGLFSYLVRRLVLSVPVALIVAVIAFGLIRLASGNPAVVFLGPGATDQEIADISRQLGLDQPLPVQFAIWIGGILQGDLGRSFFLGRDVSVAIIERLPATLQLTALAFFFALIIGIPAGILSQP